MKNEKVKQLFKSYAARENSVENVLFYDSVMKYKKQLETQNNDSNSLPVNELVNYMIDNYLDPYSILGINTSGKLIKQVKSSFEKNGATIELFDDLLIELEGSAIMDTFQRFVSSEQFESNVQIV
jgi:rubrerythrin